MCSGSEVSTIMVISGQSGQRDHGHQQRRNKLADALAIAAAQPPGGRIQREVRRQPGKTDRTERHQRRNQPQAADDLFPHGIEAR